jgi:hypothetical protein
MPGGLAMFLLTPLSGRLSELVQPKWLMTVGFTTIAFRYVPFD